VSNFLQSSCGLSNDYHAAALRLSGSGTGGGPCFYGYLTLPDNRASLGRGLIVLQEIYGLNAEVRRVCDWLASNGYHALAPDLYWKSGNHVEYDYEDRPNALAHARSLDFNVIAEDIKAGFVSLERILGGREKVGILALGWGGKPGLMARKSLPGVPMSIYYPGGLAGEDNLINDSVGATQYHFGLLDERSPQEFCDWIASLYQGKDGFEMHVYENSLHGFANHGRKEYHEDNARIVYERTLEFFDAQFNDQ